MSGYLAIHVEFYHNDVKISHMIALFSGLCRETLAGGLYIENKQRVTFQHVTQATETCQRSWQSSEFCNKTQV